MKYVIAADSWQFKSYLSENRLTVKDAVFVHNPEMLRGLRLKSEDIVYYGTWYTKGPVFRDHLQSVLEQVINL